MKIRVCEILPTHPPTHPPDFTSRAPRLVAEDFCQCFCRFVLSIVFSVFDFCDVFACVHSGIVLSNGIVSRRKKSRVADVVPLPTVCFVILHVPRVLPKPFVPFRDCSKRTSHVLVSFTLVFVVWARCLSSLCPLLD